MATTSVTIRMDENLKKQAEVLFDEMGLNMTTLKEFGMDPMEKLFYERQEFRKKAYARREKRRHDAVCQPGRYGFSYTAVAVK